MMSSVVNPEATAVVIPNVANTFDSEESKDSTGHNDAPKPTKTSLKARDISPDAVTSPLEALALACVAEKASEDEQTSNEGQTNTFTETDVLCGRGGLTNNAPGNIYFRSLVRMKQEAYLLATKREKAGVACEIVAMVRSLSPPGRFLKKDPNGVWVEIGDRKAREKTSQALREGAPELRQELTSTQAASSRPHVIPASTGPTYQHHPRKFFKPTSFADNNILSSNRARVVSDDSLMGMQSSFVQNDSVTAVVGSKRKVDDPSSCSLQEQKLGEQQSDVKRGPRLKLLKSRLCSY